MQTSKFTDAGNPITTTTIRKRKPIEQHEHRHRHQVLLLRQLALQHGTEMAFTFAAFSYIVALIVDAFLIFFAIFHVSSQPQLRPRTDLNKSQCLLKSNGTPSFIRLDVFRTPWLSCHDNQRRIESLLLIVVAQIAVSKTVRIPLLSFMQSKC